MSAEKHPINQCHYGPTVKTLEEKIDWNNREIERLHYEVARKQVGLAAARDALREVVQLHPSMEYRGAYKAVLDAGEVAPNWLNEQKALVWDEAADISSAVNSNHLHVMPEFRRRAKALREEGR